MPSRDAREFLTALVLGALVGGFVAVLARRSADGKGR